MYCNGDIWLLTSKTLDVDLNSLSEEEIEV